LIAVTINRKIFQLITGFFYEVMPLPINETLAHHAKAPPESINQINVTTNKIEDQNGNVAGNWV
jgi:hypothetical protein